MTIKLSIAFDSLFRQRAAEIERTGYPEVQINVVWSAPGAESERVMENEFKGLLPFVLHDAINHIGRIYLTQTVIKTGGTPRVRRFWNFSIDAIKEALINAIFHQSYEEPTPVEVQVTRREISILSFPGPDPSIRMEDVQAGRAVSLPHRNHRIGEILKELDLAEGRSTGIPKMLEAVRKNGSPVPIFESDERRTWFLVRLPVHEQTCPGPGESETVEIST
ncbi:MAG: hypothetical protein M2R45_00409 [Verrucomicrobia subdivision 3 bacterium]|nr:hypothetical protein [Limisphaerales bacterium]MCS1412832.1 hypothetical protein [Limisphaerales bacterium]